MTVAPQNESHGKSVQATFLKVGQNLYRNESSDTYYGLTKRGGKQFRTALDHVAGRANAKIADTKGIRRDLNQAYAADHCRESGTSVNRRALQWTDTGQNQLRTRS